VDHRRGSARDLVARLPGVRCRAQLVSSEKEVMVGRRGQQLASQLPSFCPSGRRRPNDGWLRSRQSAQASPESLSSYAGSGRCSDESNDSSYSEAAATDRSEYVPALHPGRRQIRPSHKTRRTATATIRRRCTANPASNRIETNRKARINTFGQSSDYRASDDLLVGRLDPTYNVPVSIIQDRPTPTRIRRHHDDD
jgi:hypothetical protein